MSNTAPISIDIREARVAVLGGAGFLGSHMVDLLHKVYGCRVLVIDSLVAGAQEFIGEHLRTGSAVLEKVCITKTAKVANLISSFEAVMVYNFAAYPYIPTCYHFPEVVVATNFIAPMRLMEAIRFADGRARGVKRFVQISSAEIYGDSKGTMLDEDYFVRPHSTYGSSKAAVDYYIQARFRESKLPAVAIRQFNCAGPRETHPYVIPEIIRQISAGMSANPGTKEVNVYLGNNSTRDFMFVKDAVSTIADLSIRKGIDGEVFNLGSGSTTNCVSIYSLARIIGNIYGVTAIPVFDPSRVRAWEIWALRSNNDKIEGVIGSKVPFTLIDDIINHTIRYYETNGRRWRWEVKP